MYKSIIEYFSLLDLYIIEPEKVQFTERSTIIKYLRLTKASNNLSMISQTFKQGFYDYLIIFYLSWEEIH